MVEVSVLFIISVLIAGMLTFLAPCTLPLVPAYLAFIAGTDTHSGNYGHRAIRTNALAFVMGFSCVFVGVGATLGFFGSWIGEFRAVLSQIGGLLIIIFGLMMLNVINISVLQKRFSVTPPAMLTPGTIPSAFLVGAIFALGWTPCVGPILASVLTLAASSGTAATGAVLLGVFSLGLAIPFILTAALYAHTTRFSRYTERIAHIVQYVGGALLLFVGVLLMLGNLDLTVSYGYQLFGNMGLEGLFDRL